MSASARLGAYAPLTDGSRGRSLADEPQSTFDDLMATYESRAESPSTAVSRRTTDFSIPASSRSSADESVCQDAAAAQAWGRFLHRFSWEWYCHLTFRRNLSVDRALMTFCHWMHRQNRREFGNRYASRGHQGIRHVRGLEWQNRGAPHFHVLMMDSDRLDIDEATADWKKLAGDALIVPYDDSRGGSFYVAKTSGPGGRGELDFGGQWSVSDSGRLREMRS